MGSGERMFAAAKGGDRCSWSALLVAADDPPGAHKCRRPLTIRVALMRLQLRRRQTEPLQQRPSKLMRCRIKGHQRIVGTR